MIHNHEVPSSILGLATDLEAPAAVWLRFLLGDIYDIRALLIDSFGRWDEYGRRTAACDGWMGSGVGRWDEYGELEWVAGDGWLDG